MAGKSSDLHMHPITRDSECPFNGLKRCSGADVEGCPLGVTSRDGGVWCALSLVVFEMAGTRFVESFEVAADALTRIADKMQEVG